MTPIEIPTEPSLPFPIFQISRQVERYLLYDIEIVTWLRQAHNILGVLIGTLSQSPQQNVFLGLPLELQPEEARFLVNRGLAFAVSDLERHRTDLASKNAEWVESMKEAMRKRGMDVAKRHRQSREQRTQCALKKIRNREDVLGERDSNSPLTPEAVNDPPEETLFENSVTADSAIIPTQTDDLSPILWTITPTTSQPPPTPPSDASPLIIPTVKVSSYALFRHLHDLGYFMTPGIRFGCQFAVYPGDPLRFHSHFLSMSYDWDEEIDLLDLIGGGRLGTGVKKGWLIGGLEDSKEEPEDKGVDGSVRAFCIEWGGM